MPIRTVKIKKPITIIARRWFQKSYGNTYHSVTIRQNGEIIAEARKIYGYGDQYKQTACQLLQNLNMVPKMRKPTDHADTDYCMFLQFAMDHRDRVTFIVSDVSRERDL